MADGGFREPSVVLSNCFQIRRRSYGVFLNSYCLYWERDGRHAHDQQVPLSEVVAVKAVETPSSSSSSNPFCCFVRSPSSSSSSGRGVRDGGYGDDDRDEDRVDGVSVDSRRTSSELVPFATSAFQVHHVQRDWKHRWKVRCVTFRHANSLVVQQWISALQDAVNGFSHRPRHLLVFVNPFGGKKRAPKIYESKVRPLFELAGIDTDVVVTERANHAFDLLQDTSLAKLDGVVAVGGDGTLSEVLHGLLLRTQKDSGVDFNDSQTQLRRPDLRLGIIPAGSTDATAFSINGTNDPVTAALHIILGDRLSVDVCGVFHDQRLLRYSTTMLGYGFLGDTLMDSERNRWMGPRRYDWSAFKKLMGNRAYEGEILFRASPQPDTSPMGKDKCHTGCKVCAKARDHLHSVHKDDEDSWTSVRGQFMGINNATMKCACEIAKQGVSPTAHLGDGCSDLIVIKKCSRLNYARFLMRIALGNSDSDPFSLDFISVHRVREFHFRPIRLDDADEHPDADHAARPVSRRASTLSSRWNCDGELIEEPAISAKVYCQLVPLFSRGIEDDLFESGHLPSSRRGSVKYAVNSSSANLCS